MQSFHRIVFTLLSLPILGCTHSRLLKQTPTGPATKSGLAVYMIGIGKIPLIVIPGGPGASSKLYRRYLGPLGERHRLVFWDYRGTGNSKPTTAFGFAHDHADLKEVIQSLNAPRVSLLAHSYGGVHAVKLASENTHLIDKLILVSTSPHFLSSAKESI